MGTQIIGNFGAERVLASVLRLIGVTQLLAQGRIPFRRAFPSHKTRKITGDELRKLRSGPRLISRLLQLLHHSVDAFMLAHCRTLPANQGDS